MTTAQMDLLFRDVPNTTSGWAMLVVFVVTIIWGLSSIAAAIRERNRVGIRPFWQTFRFWLGVFLVWCDAMFYGLVAFNIMRQPEASDLWGVALVGSWGVVALIAFMTWAREEAEARQIVVEEG